LNSTCLSWLLNSISRHTTTPESLKTGSLSPEYLEASERLYLSIIQPLIDHHLRAVLELGVETMTVTRELGNNRPYHFPTPIIFLLGISISNPKLPTITPKHIVLESALSPYIGEYKPTRVAAVPHFLNFSITQRELTIFRGLTTTPNLRQLWPKFVYYQHSLKAS
jgi:hypothetical protein